MTGPVIPPIVKELVVAVDQATAFRTFTEQVRSWWPLATHSVGGEDARGLRLDRQGFVETLADGSECTWGSVLAWDPPSRLVMTWHPGQAPDPHTQVVVTFHPESGGTRVRLVHSGWESLRLGHEQLAGRVGEYRGGWDVVLGRYLGVFGEVEVA